MRQLSLYSQVLPLPLGVPPCRRLHASHGVIPVTVTFDVHQLSVSVLTGLEGTRCSVLLASYVSSHLLTRARGQAHGPPSVVMYWDAIQTERPQHGFRAATSTKTRCRRNFSQVWPPICQRDPIPTQPPALAHAPPLQRACLTCVQATAVVTLRVRVAGLVFLRFAVLRQGGAWVLCCARVLVMPVARAQSRHLLPEPPPPLSRLRGLGA